MKDVGVPSVAGPSKGLLLGSIELKINLNSLFFNILHSDVSFLIVYLCKVITSMVIRIFSWESHWIQRS